MPPVISPEAISSSHAPKDMRFGLLPRRLVRDQRRGRDGLRPYHLELAVLPLGHGAGRRDVLAAAELDLADDGAVLGVGHVVADRLAVQAMLADRGGED